MDAGCYFRLRYQCTSYILFDSHKTIFLVSNFQATLASPLLPKRKKFTRTSERMSNANNQQVVLLASRWGFSESFRNIDFVAVFFCTGTVAWFGLWWIVFQFVHTFASTVLRISACGSKQIRGTFVQHNHCTLVYLYGWQNFLGAGWGAGCDVWFKYTCLLLVCIEWLQICLVFSLFVFGIPTYAKYVLI